MFTRVMLNTLVNYQHVHKGSQSVLFFATDVDMGVYKRVPCVWSMRANPFV